jgi:KaiC/GvpD/RAD55 family RecA-like ATPase
MLTTKDFLSHFSNTWFQTFDDQESQKRKALSTPTYSEADFKFLNEDGFGIYFSVNGFGKGGRLKENLVGFGGVYADMDVSEKNEPITESQHKARKAAMYEAVLDLELKPHIIVFTKNGIQPIWLVEEPVHQDNIKTYRKLQENIVDWTKEVGSKGDDLKDTTRVLRVPGYYHCKDPNNRFLIEAQQVYIEKKPKKYKFAELLEFFKGTRVVSSEDGERFLKVDGGSLILPEAFEGDRNNTLSKLVGGLIKYINPKAWNVAAWAAAKEWNSSLEDPLPIAEVRQTFESICRAELRKRDRELIPDQFRSSFEEKLLDQIEQEKHGESFMSGYNQVDELLGGFRYRNNYFVAGIDKSGKSSFLMRILERKLADPKSESRIGFLNTELTELEFTQRMAALKLGKSKDDVTFDESVAWLTKYKDRFEYAGNQELSGDNDSIMEVVDRFVEKGVDCLVVDNITTFSAGATDEEGWSRTSKLLSKIFTKTKSNRLVTFIVAHAKTGDITFNQKISPNKDYSEDPTLVFQKGNTYVGKPNMSHIYGGGMILSQISGLITIWRPFQKYSNQEKGQEKINEMQSYAQIGLESMRYSRDGVVRMKFDGARGLFTEEDDIVEELKGKAKDYYEK